MVYSYICFDITVTLRLLESYDIHHTTYSSRGSSRGRRIPSLVIRGSTTFYVSKSPFSGMNILSVGPHHRHVMVTSHHPSFSLPSLSQKSCDIGELVCHYDLNDRSSSHTPFLPGWSWSWECAPARQDRQRL